MKDFGATILRVIVGIVYVMHAYLSLVVFTPTGAADFMKAAGLPAPVLMAWIVVVVHSLGGIMLVVGLWTRVAAAANAVIILGGILTVHLPQGFFTKVIGGQPAGYEFPLLLLGASVALILTGGGALAITRDR
ncbi:MAG: DoxX family protein [Candidatus Rokuibacteriota bacterium]